MSEVCYEQLHKLRCMGEGGRTHLTPPLKGANRGIQQVTLIRCALEARKAMIYGSQADMEE